MTWVFCISCVALTASSAFLDFLTLKYFPGLYNPDTTKYQIFIVGYSVVLAVDYALKKYLGKK